MNTPLPIYDVKELSMEEVVVMLSQSEKNAANDVDLSEVLDFKELALLLQA